MAPEKAFRIRRRSGIEACPDVWQVFKGVPVRFSHSTNHLLLSFSVSVHEKGENETILFMEGSEENDKAALKESGKAVEKNSKKFESISAGQVRGLQVLHFEVSEKDKTYTLVMGWSAENAKAIENLETGGDGKEKPKVGDPKKPDEDKKPPIDKKIEDKKATSDDAKKFLP